MLMEGNRPYVSAGDGLSLTQQQLESEKQRVQDGGTPMINGTYVQPPPPPPMSQNEFKGVVRQSIDNDLQKKASLTGNGDPAFSYMNRRSSKDDRPDAGQFFNTFSPVTVSNPTPRSSSVPNIFGNAYGADVVPSGSILNNSSRPITGPVVNDVAVQETPTTETVEEVTEQPAQPTVEEQTPPATQQLKGALPSVDETQEVEIPDFRTQLMEREGTNTNDKGEHVVYRDSTGNLTVGRGHKLTEEEAKNFKEGDVWTGTDVEELFENDTQSARNSAIQQAKDLNINNDNLIDAFTHVNYQLGEGWQQEFPKAAELIREGKYNEAAEEFSLNKDGSGPSDWMKQTPKRVEDLQNALRSVGGEEQPTRTGALTFKNEGVDTSGDISERSTVAPDGSLWTNPNTGSPVEAFRSKYPEFDNMPYARKQQFLSRLSDTDPDMYLSLRKANGKEGTEFEMPDLDSLGINKNTTDAQIDATVAEIAKADPSFQGSNKQRYMIDLKNRLKQKRAHADGGVGTYGAEKVDNLVTTGQYETGERAVSDSGVKQLPPEQEVVEVKAGPKWTVGDEESTEVSHETPPPKPTDFDKPQNNMGMLDKELMVQHMVKPQNKGFWDGMLGGILKDNQMKKALVMGGITGVIAALGGSSAKTALGFGLAGAYAQYNQNPNKASAMKLMGEVGKYVSPDDQAALSEAMTKGDWTAARSILTKGFGDYELLSKGYFRDESGGISKVMTGTEMADMQAKQAATAKTQAETRKIFLDEKKGVTEKALSSRKIINDVESADFLLSKGEGGMVPWYAGLYEKSLGKVLPDGVGLAVDRMGSSEYNAVKAEFVKFTSTLSASQMEKYGANPSMNEAEKANAVAETLLQMDEKTARFTIEQIRNDKWHELQLMGYTTKTTKDKNGRTKTEIVPPDVDYQYYGFKSNPYATYDLTNVLR